MTLPRGRPAEPFDVLAGELRSAMVAWSGEAGAWNDEELDAWARRAFRLQFVSNRVFRRYCEARRIDPADVAGWRDYPPVPTAAFRAVDLIVGMADDAQLIFRTSGTTGGSEARGRHLVRSADLYRTSLRTSFQAFVLRESSAKIVTLPPSFTLDGTSSLGWMLDDLRTGIGRGDGLAVASAHGVDWAALDAEVRRAVETGRPLCVLGTTVGFAEWSDRMESGGCVVAALPAGSMLMDTGGAKGRPGLARSEVVRGLSRLLGVAPGSIFNEFGMTELLSQRYARGFPGTPLLGPPWLRTRVLDPVTLADLPEGDTGLLCHFDLANLGSVCSILTEDMGRISGDGIEWLGRAEGAPPRGCSLATAELLEAQERA